jgi:hypothetical protein
MSAYLPVAGNMIELSFRGDLLTGYIIGLDALNIIYPVESHHDNITSHLYTYDIFSANRTTHYLHTSNASRYNPSAIIELTLALDIYTHATMTTKGVRYSSTLQQPYNQPNLDILLQTPKYNQSNTLSIHPK